MSLKVSDSFILTGRGISTFIKNVENGLPENSILFSEKRNLEWRVKYRMLWMHSVSAQKRFSNEKESIGHSSFKIHENYEEQMNNIIENELDMGMEYMLEPVSHNYKPEAGEILILKTK